MNNDKKRYIEAWHRGKHIRQLQDDILATFVAHIQSINDVETLEAINKEMNK